MGMGRRWSSSSRKLELDAPPAEWYFATGHVDDLDEDAVDATCRL
jgi:hypothetical protein